MNIFILDTDPRKCAEYHCDKHVIKMISEYSQILSSFYRIQYPDAFFDEYWYPLKFKNHPTVKFALECQDNVLWLNNLLKYLLDEYDYRFGKPGKYVRARQVVNQYVLGTCGYIVNAPLLMPDEYKVAGDPVQSYRNYYIGEKMRFAKWTKREKPYWI